MTLIFRTAHVDVTPDCITATFADGRENRFHLSAMAGDQEYARIAAWAGYGDDWRRYGLHHELTHHAMADRLGMRWSWSLHDNLPQPWPDHIAWEECLVNASQRCAMTGAKDDHGQLDRVFGDDLDGWIAELQRVWALVE